MKCLELADVSYRYEGSTEYVLKNISAAFESGKVYTVIGESGAGKSTLLSLISGLDVCEIIVRAVDRNAIAAACDAVINANILPVIDETPVATTNYSASSLEDQSEHGRLHGEYLQGLLDNGETEEINADIIPVNVLYRLALFISMATTKRILVAENVLAAINPIISILLCMLNHSPPFITIKPCEINKQMLFITIPTRNGASQ